MDYLRRFVVWFLSGLGLAAGAAIVIWVYSHAYEREQSAKFDRTLPSSVVAVSGIEPIGITDNAAVSATLQNNSSEEIGVTLELSITQDSRVLYTCDRQAVSTPAPGKSARVQVSCHGVKRSNVPANSKYQLRVARVVPVP